MSDRPQIPGSDDDRYIVAGEYVLRLIPEEEAMRVEADPSMAPLIASWEQRLAPLLTVPAPVPPPADLWHRIARSTGIADRPVRSPRGSASWARSIAFWRAATAGMSLAAVVLAGVILSRDRLEDRQARFVAALAPTDAQAGFVVSLAADGSLTVENSGRIHARSGRDLELWVLPDGEKEPRSLGVLRGEGNIAIREKMTFSSAQFMITDEPSGGSSTGQVSGAILFAGRLSPLPE
ncbi:MULTISPECIES: anti-sigma factor [Acetobacteraceae]|uniref:Anti-sigma K factor RskA C-terminal domain-containing protein n=1 Tax=Gluconacetobacter dulcium TaxID=2729096 RepID=A0A7W4NWA1_9PROT|nr:MULTISPECIES: anti-sigma factor [Acetobacteraceae]MBB2165270.1 hypothetical protein [Gluconacetobacter dulcium]MBB2194321.1 hypothetical protein [Gluconacetobacter dulcium]MCP1239655.1 anti-sigma factor [Acetobacter lovaniensis]MCQ9156721.1 anti-sigma factor [Acidomonas methanolica]